MPLSVVELSGYEDGLSAVGAGMHHLDSVGSGQFHGEVALLSTARLETHQRPTTDFLQK